MRIETKSEIGEFFKKLQEYLKKHKIFKNHHINIADFDDSNPRVWGMAISIFPIGTKDELFQQQNGDNLFIYNIQFWKKWHKTERVIIFAFWAGENAEKAEEFNILKKEWPNKSNETKSGFSYNVDNDGNYLDLSKRNIPNELKEMPNEIEENVIFPIIEKTLEKLYADYNNKFYELFNLSQIDKYQQVIKEYIDYCKSDEIWDEAYKWQAISHFQSVWDIDAPDFGEMFKEAVKKRSNLIHALPIATLIDGAKIYPETVKGIIRYIFNEERDIIHRFNYFKSENIKLAEKLKTHHELDKPPTIPREAEFAFLLACKNPNKHYFYNSRFYIKFSKYIGQEPKKAGEKYGHYLELMNYFRDNYVIKNSEVIEITKQKLPENEQNKENITLITQSIIYLVFEVIRNNADEKNLISALEEIDYENANNLYNLIDKLVLELKIENEDERVHYNCTPKDNFNITVGQRYAIRLDTKNYNWDIIIPKETDIAENKIGYKFDGKPETISFRTNNFSELKFYEKEFIEASLGELNRTTKSGYRKSTNLAFEKSIFDLEYRNEIFNQVFEQDFNNSIVLNEKTETKKINMPINQVLFGPPGTGKTYHTINKAVEIADNDFYNQTINNRTELKRRFKELKESSQVVFTTFHQSMSYEEFLESLKPFEKENKVYYKIEDGIFKQICEKASQTKRMSITIENKEVEFTKEILQDLYSSYVENLPDQKNEISEIILSTTEGAPFQLFKNSANSIVVKAGEKKATMSVSANELINIYFENKNPTYKSYAHKIFDDILTGKNFKKIDNDNSKKNFVLIIDEINRGNIASIFGELITLIEPDKRKGEDEELSVKLPYSKQDFTVPKNLYIIGTMNTADRSVEALDSALRRRFVFIEMPPDETLLDKDFFGINLQEVLRWINLRIEKLIDKDHKIGHSYFMNLKIVDDLQNAFKNKIIPLLEEYFYGDFAKIGLVLGVDFVLKSDFEENIFKSIDDIDNYTDFENRVIYKTTVPESIDEFINAVKNIYL